MLKTRGLACAAFVLLSGCAERTAQPDSSPASTHNAAPEPRAADLETVAGTLASRAWVLVGFGEAGDPPTSTDPITLQMDAMGKLNGFGGCNRYHSTYRLGDDPGTVSIEAVAATRMACAAPDMEAEQRYFYGLGRVRRLSIDGNRLILSDDGGRRVLEYRGEPEDPRWEAGPGNP